MVVSARALLVGFERTVHVGHGPRRCVGMQIDFASNPMAWYSWSSRQCLRCLGSGVLSREREGRDRKKNKNRALRLGTRFRAFGDNPPHWYWRIRILRRWRTPATLRRQYSGFCKSEQCDTF